MNEKIIEAINERRIIGFYYDGGYRTVEPYVYGVSGTGHEVLRAYQLGGHSDSGEHEGWKLFKTSRIKNLVETGEFFTDVRSDFNKEDPAVKEIFAEI
ncbi:MAG: WYL domain-containing protein [Bacteroidota bacterium]